MALYVIIAHGLCAVRVCVHDCACVCVCVCVCVRYLHNMGDEGDEHLDKVVPTVSEFCEYVQW